MTESAEQSLTAMAHTAAGREAYAMLDWVFDDPTARAAQGKQRLATLIEHNQSDEAASRELGDVGTILARLG